MEKWYNKKSFAAECVAPPDKGVGGFENKVNCDYKKNQEDVSTFSYSLLFRDSF